ncbi:MAG: hypothetical protein P8O04_01775 [Flavobacteriaceae bacterium]|nr:hypothetical protein [Flavobacteriaceae bacterium]
MLERTALRCSLLAYLLFFSIGSSNLWSQLTASPTLTTNFGNGSTVIACSSDTLEYSVQANPVDPNTVLNYRYVLHRNGANSYLTTHTVSATATQNDFSQNVQDGDRVFAEVYAVSATSTPTFLAKTQSFTVYFVNTPQVSITHSAQTESNTAVFCPGQTTTITVTPLQFQQGTNQYEFFVNSLSKQGPSTDNVFAYEFTENATLTVRVSNACVLEESISFKSNEVTPGSISITSSNSIGSTVSASHSGGLTGLASISYEWESSFDNTNWNRVLMANAPSLTNITINQATYFRRVAISSYGNAQCKSFSNAVLMTLMFDETIAQTSQDLVFYTLICKHLHLGNYTALHLQPPIQL